MSATISGGDKLQAYLSRIAGRMANAKVVNVGFKEGATEAGGGAKASGVEPDGTSIPMIAAIQEFGAPRAGIPPRPFFRNMIAAKKGEWPQAIADLLVANDFDARATLTQTGERVAFELKQSITDTNDPPLSPVTVMLRSMRRENPNLVVNASTVVEARRRVAAGKKPRANTSTKPLIDIGTMQQQVGFFVE